MSKGLDGCEQQVTAIGMPYASMEKKKKKSKVTCKIGARQIGARQIGARQIVVTEVSFLKVDVGEIDICTKHSGQSSTCQHEQN